MRIPCRIILSSVFLSCAVTACSGGSGSGDSATGGSSTTGDGGVTGAGGAAAGAPGGSGGTTSAGGSTGAAGSAGNYDMVGQTAAAALTFNGDKAHFNKAGATAMAQLASKELTRIKSPLAGYLK